MIAYLLKITVFSWEALQCYLSETRHRSTSKSSVWVCACVHTPVPQAVTGGAGYSMWVTMLSSLLIFHLGAGRKKWGRETDLLWLRWGDMCFCVFVCVFYVHVFVCTASAFAYYYNTTVLFTWSAATDPLHTHTLSAMIMFVSLTLLEHWTTQLLCTCTGGHRRDTCMNLAH